ncbi:hypothetical protein MKW94_002268 [Papaver nudicaule]|uniref:Uncharacterized protein n=1 Tax=Papaver nudicaule TaxID=74823 RepID=A0AA41RKX6_PAPNU|nr:hypothetical protein [Papaver nudicaule]
MALWWPSHGLLQNNIRVLLILLPTDFFFQLISISLKSLFLSKYFLVFFFKF